MKEKINPIKLDKTKINCRKESKIIFLLIIFLSFKFFIEKKMIKTEQLNPKISEKYPI